jgi:hypothetical protein
VYVCINHSPDHQFSMNPPTYLVCVCVCVCAHAHSPSPATYASPPTHESRPGLNPTLTRTQPHTTTNQKQATPRTRISNHASTPLPTFTPPTHTTHTTVYSSPNNHRHRHHHAPTHTRRKEKTHESNHTKSNQSPYCMTPKQIEPQASTLFIIAYVHPSSDKENVAFITFLREEAARLVREMVGVLCLGGWVGVCCVVVCVVCCVREMMGVLCLGGWLVLRG